MRQWMVEMSEDYQAEIDKAYWDGYHKGKQELQEEFAQVTDQVLRVVRGEFAQICSYCGWEANRDGATWEELQAHIQECKEHPIFKLKEELARYKGHVELLRNAAYRLISEDELCSPHPLCVAYYSTGGEK